MLTRAVISSSRVHLRLELHNSSIGLESQTNANPSISPIQDVAGSREVEVVCVIFCCYCCLCWVSDSAYNTGENKKVGVSRLVAIAIETCWSHWLGFELDWDPCTPCKLQACGQGPCGDNQFIAKGHENLVRFWNHFARKRKTSWQLLRRKEMRIFPLLSQMLFSCRTRTNVVVHKQLQANQAHQPRLENGACRVLTREESRISSQTLLFAFYDCDQSRCHAVQTKKWLQRSCVQFRLRDSAAKKIWKRKRKNEKELCVLI